MGMTRTRAGRKLSFQPAMLTQKLYSADTKHAHKARIWKWNKITTHLWAILGVIAKRNSKGIGSYLYYEFVAFYHLAHSKDASIESLKLSQVGWGNQTLISFKSWDKLVS